MNCYKFKDIPQSINSNSKNLIQISPTNTNKVNTKTNAYSYAYSLNNSFFDPCKGSPPNEFMLKLEKRFNIYNTSEIK